MGKDMRGSSRWMRNLGRGSITMQTKTAMRGSGRMTCTTDMVNKCITMGLALKGAGKMTKKMGTEFSRMLMGKDGSKHGRKA